MTKEEAIKQLKDNRVMCINSETEPFAIAYDMAIKALEQEPRWIPVSERLPEEKTTVFISCEDMYLQKLNPCVGWRNGQYWNTFTANGCKQILYPTAWMPLPKAYREVEK